MTQTQTPQAVRVTVRDAFKGVDIGTPLMAFDKPWTGSQAESDLLRAQYGIAADMRVAAPRTPVVNPDYVWDGELLKLLIANEFAGGTSAKLIGYSGTGKSACVLQFHGALNRPLYTVVANPHMQACDLIGRYVPDGKGAMVWADGPVLAAARLGVPILIDEYNVLDPGEATGLNAFLEGYAYTVPETGETIRRAPGFRVFATVNPKAVGYTGRQLQDFANDNRFSPNVVLGYPEEQVETQIVATMLVTKLRQVPSFATNLGEVIVKAANKVRAAYMGENDGADALPFTMTRRDCLEWAKWSVLCQGMKLSSVNPLYKALELTVGNRLDRTDNEALRNIVELATGQKPDDSKMGQP